MLASPGIDALLSQAIPAVTPAAQLVVWRRGERVVDLARGWIDPDTRTMAVTADTVFDLASITKLYTVMVWMRLVEQQRVGLDDAVSSLVPSFTGLRPIKAFEDPLQPGATITIEAGPPADAGQITFRQLLTHTSGLPAWRPLYQQPTRTAALAMAVSTDFAYPPGRHVVYSDLGLIVLGLAVEALAGCDLETAIRQHILDPLGLARTGFRPGTRLDTAECAPTELCPWRGRRLHGEVHDENAARLEGVSGHAGLFATARDVAAFGQALLVDRLVTPVTRQAMIQEQAREHNVRRGLGFALWSPDPEASSHPFGPRTFGHTGFTGTSLWIDPDRDLVTALLTNDVYFGRAGRGIAPLRLALHRAVVQWVATGLALKS